jgi:hypothetical protein
MSDFTPVHEELQRRVREVRDADIVGRAALGIDAFR